jgi:hypothetical protein
MVEALETQRHMADCALQLWNEGKGLDLGTCLEEMRDALRGAKGEP